MIVTFPLEVEQQVKARAAQKGLDVVSYLLSLIQKDTGTQIALEQSNGASDSDYNPDALNQMIARMTSRTPEERREARERAIKESQPKIELPPDISPFDVMPVIRGNETDDEVIQALKELS